MFGNKKQKKSGSGVVFFFQNGTTNRRKKIKTNLQQKLKIFRFSLRPKNGGRLVADCDFIDKTKKIRIKINYYSFTARSVKP